MASAILVDGLGKCYRVDHASPRGAKDYRTLREDLARAFDAPRRLLLGGASSRRRSEDFWALRDVGFEIRAGEVVGIIGRNGAGKSTLLKILSRITKPTTGRAELHGRVGSLLEVGTGFHPELTGRENVFLNGGILGMSRREIHRQFDEIVAFAEVERFIDTPVKRYSSGMHVRLAFAVAAHLEPEILIVDEVLAVGDAAFQKKCLGKMSDVSRHGRTVLFVSHNMAAVSMLCHRVIAMKAGQVWADGRQEVIQSYLNSVIEYQKFDFADREDIRGKAAWFTDLGFEDGRGAAVPSAMTGRDLVLRIGYEARDSGGRDVAFTFYDRFGNAVFHCDTAYSAKDDRFARSGRRGVVRCRLPRLPLAEGEYRINLLLHRDGEPIDHVEGAARLAVEAGDFHGTGKVPPPGYCSVLVDHEWESVAEVR